MAWHVIRVRSKDAQKQLARTSLTGLSRQRKIRSIYCKQWALGSWGHVTTIFLKIFYIMGYNLKNARNGKSISKILKWQSLWSLASKSKAMSTRIRKFFFSANIFLRIRKFSRPHAAYSNRFQPSTRIRMYPEIL